MKFATVNGVTLHHACDGKPGGIPLVFINSLGCDLRIWDDVIPHFADRFPIIRYDTRGHGLSDCPPGPYSIRDHTEDLAGLLAYLRVDSMILIGISVGGMIALDYASQHPETIRLLVLSDTGARIGTAELWNQRITGLRQHGMDALGEAILERWFVPDFRAQRPDDYRGYSNMLIHMPVAGYTATCEAIREADLTSSARMITARALVLGGVEDMATTPGHLRELAGALPDARLELIEGAAHLPCIEQPAAMAAAISRFLAESGYA